MINHPPSQAKPFTAVASLAQQQHYVQSSVQSTASECRILAMAPRWINQSGPDLRMNLIAVARLEVLWMGKGGSMEGNISL